MSKRSKKNKNVMDTSIVDVKTKTESKRRLTNHLQSRPSKEQLIEKGIFKKADKKAMKAARRAEKKNKKKRGKSKGGDTEFELPIIGIPLALLQSREGTEVPKLVTECVAYIRKNGLQMQGLFRVAGEKPKVEAIRKAFESGTYTSMEELNCDVPSVSSLLKLFFRELPEPLFTFELHPKFVACLADPNRLTTWANLIEMMPRVHKATLRFLFPFLVEVAANSSVNLMDPSNVGIVFGPTLLRSLKEFNTGEVDLSNKAQHVVEGMVESWAQLSTITPTTPTIPGLVRPPSGAFQGLNTAALPPPGITSSFPPPGSSLPPPGSTLPPPASLPGRAPSMGSLPALATRSSPNLTVPAAKPAGKTGLVLYNFTGDPAKGQINLVANSQVTVFESHASGWSSGESNGQRGYFPSNYVRIM